MRILTANDSGIIRQMGGYKAFIVSQARQYWNIPDLSPDWSPFGEPIRAVVVGSKWAVRCPDCGELCAIAPGETWWCWRCGNAANAGQARPVEWPTNRAAIEAILLKRINPDTRNWTTETESELRRENITHGESAEV